MLLGLMSDSVPLTAVPAQRDEAPSTAVRSLIWHVGVWGPGILTPFALYMLIHACFPFAVRVSPRYYQPRCYVVYDGPEVAAAGITLFGLLVALHLIVVGWPWLSNPARYTQHISYAAVTIAGYFAIVALVAVPLSHSARYVAEARGIVLLEPLWRRPQHVDEGFRKWVEARRFRLFRPLEKSLAEGQAAGGYNYGWAFDRRGVGQENLHRHAP